MKDYRPNKKQTNEFHELGFVIIRNFLPKEQAYKIKEIASHDDIMAINAYEKMDASGLKSKVTLWYEPGEDVFGRLSCSHRLLQEMGCFLGGNAEFFHAKLMQKEPKQGGSWEWHQDYGYWYDDGFMSDAMASCYVALDPAVKANGCLSVIPGSHRYGRIRHGGVGEQVGADIERVNFLKEKFGQIFCEMDAGDALYFHSNLLHSSGTNLSDHSRWGLISSFFRDDNISINPDPRFHKKPIATVAHHDIIKGAMSSQKDKDFLNL